MMNNVTHTPALFAALLTTAGQCCLGDRLLLPEALRAQLATDVTLAFQRLVTWREPVPENHFAGLLLQHAALAVVAYPTLSEPLAALRAAYALMRLWTDAAPQPDGPDSWERKVGLLG